MNVIDRRIAQEFKLFYRRLLDEGTSLPFDQILERVHNYLEVNCSETTQAQLKLWHANIAEHLFLKDLVGDESFEELVFFGQHTVIKDDCPQHPIQLNDDDFILAWTQLAFNHNVEWNHAHPYASFAVKVGNRSLRVTLVHPCCSPEQQLRAFVRMHAARAYCIGDFCDQEAEAHILKAISDKKNILVIGQTQSGKTTLMRAMLNHIPQHEHVIILEDTNELNRSSKRTTSLLSSPNDSKRSLSEYCAMALRMSPDRIILGEIRSKEVVPLILAFNSGHRGGMSSLHADSVVDGLERLALLFHLYSGSNQLPHAKVMELICRNIDLVIHIQDKKVSDIARIIGNEGDRPLFESFFKQIDRTQAENWWQ